MGQGGILSSPALGHVSLCESGLPSLPYHAETQGIAAMGRNIQTAKGRAKVSG